MSRFDGLCHQAWVRGRRRYGGESLRGDARAEFLEALRLNPLFTDARQNLEDLPPAPR